MSKHEDRANQRLTRAYIKQKQTLVFFTPYSKVENDTGGWKYQKGMIKIQEAIRIVEITNQSGGPLGVVETLDGLERQIQFQILAEYKSQMALHDRFIVDGVEYEVVQMWPDNGWEKRASVVRRD